MQNTLVMMIGLQGSGKTEYVRRFLLPDFVHINLDTLHTRNQEQRLIDACFARNQSFVVDNTNPTREARQKYIVQAKEHGYHVIGLYMQSILKVCIERNNKRQGKARLPETAIAHTSNILTLPDFTEGFDELFYIHNDGINMWKERWTE